MTRPHPHFSVPAALGRTWLAIALVTLAGALGCDKAKAQYEECMALEAKGDVIKARDTCQAAAQADPNSKSGRAAKGKLEYLTQQAEVALAKQRAAAPRECKAKKWVTRCWYKGKKRENLLDGPTEAKCNQDADELGVVGVKCPACVCADDYVEDESEE